MTTNHKLKPGVTAADILDAIESDVISYMRKTRGLLEDDFRRLLDKCPDTRASYFRKCARTVVELRARGVAL